jgi:acyl-coenzyme A thioesterase PaaI-like protein
MDTKTITEKAKTSKLYLRLLNLGLSRMIPFNKPHGFKIIEIDDFRIKTMIPYRKSNFNHIKGLHACGLATISEFTTGLVLINLLDPKKYRLIMEKLEMEYHYQGKMDAYGEFEISEQWMQDNIYVPLTSKESAVVICKIKIHDKEGNHLTTGQIHWQIKPWNKVKTKVK